eukprot:CAMPEP_0195507410 /NCGR_PEP_ID=MMETSP0794_2-20130614/873_1 /TAXON_ID=515487 /ORGANISM="Stephanopyxis turris, Strain CCMP 815" /LENGTH=34 /DNA_ID= /DNA_START= /DNA_END= /DNA_ORIENTATION=
MGFIQEGDDVIILAGERDAEEMDNAVSMRIATCK